MTSDDSSVLLEKFCHLRLRKPYSFILKLNIYVRFSIICLVNYYTVCQLKFIFHAQIYKFLINL